MNSNHQIKGETNQPVPFNKWRIMRMVAIVMLVVIIGIIFLRLDANPAGASGIMGVTLTPTDEPKPTATEVPPTSEPKPTDEPGLPPNVEEPDISKSVSTNSVFPGDTFSYDIDVSNNDTKIRNVVVRDTLPSSLEFVNASTSKGFVYLSNNRVVVADIGGVQPNESVHIKITVKVLENTPYGQKICNSARLQYIIDGNSEASGSNSVCVTVGGPPVAGVVVTPTAVSVGTGATTPSTPAFASDGNVHYMVKYICGPQTAVETGEPVVKPANYTTAINLQNYLDSEVSLTFRPALYYTLGGTVPGTFDLKAVQVAPLSVLALDCDALWEHMGIAAGTFIEGMVDISTTTRLPVAAVYTAEITDRMDLTDTGAGISIDVEYIQPFWPYVP